MEWSLEVLNVSYGPPRNPSPAPPPGQTQTHNDAQRTLDRIQASEKARDRHAKVWTKLRKHRAGNFFQGDAGEDWLDGSAGQVQVLNLLHSYEETIKPKLLYRRPEVIAEPARISDPSQSDQIWESAKNLGQRVNALLLEVRAENQFRLNLSAAMFSAGVIQVGFDMKVGDMPTETKGADDGPVTVDLGLARSQGQEYMDGGLPYLRWIPATRFAPDPSATRIDDAGWIGVEYYRTVQDIKLDETLDPRFRENVRETHKRIPDPYGDTAGPRDGDERDPQLGMVQMYAMWNRHKRRVEHLGGRRCGSDILATVEPWEEAIEGYPFHLFGFTFIPGVFWPLPPMASWFNAAFLLDELASHAAEQATIAKKINVFDSKRIGEDAAGVIANAAEDELVGVPDIDGLKSIEIGGASKVQGDTMMQLKGYVDLIAGMSDVQRGVTPPGEKATAAEINQTLGAADLRAEDMKRTHHKFLSEVCTDFAALTIYYQQEMSDLILITDPTRRQTTDFSQPIIGEIINYRLRIEPTSTERIDRAKLLQRSEALLNLLRAPDIQQQLQYEGRAVSLYPLLEEHIRQVGYPDVSRILPELPPPEPEPGMADADAGGDPQGAPQIDPQQETQAILAGQPVDASPEDDHVGHLQVHLPASQQTNDPNLAEHVAMHERFLELAGGGGEQPQQPMPQQPMPQQPMPQPAMAGAFG